MPAPARPDRPTGDLTAETMAEALGALLPEGAIVADEGNTAGLFVAGATAGCPRHDWLTLTGGAIGLGLPAGHRRRGGLPRPQGAVASRPTAAAMYTLQALWTQAREGLDVTTIILNNRSYAILNMELAPGRRRRPGAHGPGHARPEPSPTIDFCSLAQGMGVPAARATTAEELSPQLERALAEPGPAPDRGRAPRHPLTAGGHGPADAGVNAY